MYIDLLPPVIFPKDPSIAAFAAPTGNQLFAENVDSHGLSAINVGGR